MKMSHICAVGLGALACADPLVDPQTVIGLRLLGAQVAAVDDPNRANIEPGESALQRWLVVSDVPRTYKGLALWCEGVPSSVGVPPCASPFETVEVEGSSAQPLSIPFTLPESVDRSAGWVHHLGLCETQGVDSGRVPRWRGSLQQFECAEGDLVAGVYRSNSAQANANPQLAGDVLEIDGETWPAVEPGVSPECGAGGVVDVRATAAVVIRLDVEGSDRERLDDAGYAAARRETLTFTHVTNWPGLERAYSVIDDNSSSPTIEVEFHSEQELPSGSNGQLVHFHLTVRDGRGGTDWLERWFCLKP